MHVLLQTTMDITGVLQIDRFINLAMTKLDIGFLAAFMFTSYIAKDWLCGIINRTVFLHSLKTPSMHWVVFFIGAMVAIPFIIWPDIRSNEIITKIPEGRHFYITRGYVFTLFVTYTVGTTFHDLLVYQIKKAITNIKNKLSAQNQSNDTSNKN